MSARRYFSEQDARGLIGLRVQPRVTTIRVGLPWSNARLIIKSGERGTVTQFTPGPYPESAIVGVAWDRPCRARPIDWYTEDEFRDLLVAIMLFEEEEAATPVSIHNRVEVMHT